jgi:DNA polymerase-3 subunit alpha (Gram-positive type)
MSHPLFDKPLKEMNIAVFDLETTGLYPHKDRIIQIAVVTVDAAEIEGNGWMQLVHPGDAHLPLRKKIVELTGITDERLKGQPGMAEVLRTFGDIVGTRVVSGHNVKTFDLGFIRRAEMRHGIDVQSDYYIDTLKLMQKLHPELDGHKLFECGDFYGIDYDPNALHDALADTRLCARVLLAQIEELKTKGVDTFEDMIRFLR